MRGLTTRRRAFVSPQTGREPTAAGHDPASVKPYQRSDRLLRTAAGDGRRRHAAPGPRHQFGDRSAPVAAGGEVRLRQPGHDSGYHLRNGLFGHDGAYGTDLSVHPETGMIAIFMVQCTSGDQWAARDLFLKTATEVFQKRVPSKPIAAPESRP